MLRNGNIDIDHLVEELKARFGALPDPSVPNVLRVRRELSKLLAKADPKQVIALAHELIDEPRPDEMRWVAYELVHHHRAAPGSLDADRLERFGRGINSWNTVDTFAVYLAGPV